MEQGAALKGRLYTRSSLGLRMAPPSGVTRGAGEGRRGCGGSSRNSGGGRADHSLVLIAILAGNIILGDFMRVNFAPVGVAGVLYALHRFGLEGVSFFEQLVHTFRIRTFEAGQSLQISGLAARACCQSLRCICHGIHGLAFSPNRSPS